MKKDMNFKRINFNIPISLHNRFKAAVALDGDTIAGVLEKMIVNYSNVKFGVQSVDHGKNQV